MNSDTLLLNKPEKATLPVFLLIAAIFLVAVSVRMGPMFRSLDAIDGTIVPDDAYLSLEVAKNVGLGKGPAYEDHFTNGYQPLYVILASNLYADLGGRENHVFELDKNVKKAIMMVFSFDLVSLVVLGLLLSTCYGWSVPTFVGMLIWALHPYVVATSLNGLETSMAAMFLLVITFFWGCYARSKTSIPMRFLLGLLLGLGVLSRIDLFFLGFWILVFELNDVRLKRWTFSQATVGLLITFVGFVVVYAPWVAWSYGYTGMLFPESGPAVRFQSLGRFNHEFPFYYLGGSLFSAFWIPVEKAPFLYFSALILFAWGWNINRKGKLNWYSNIKQVIGQWPIIWAFSLTLVFVYGLYIYGWWFFSRYLFITVLTAIFVITAFIQYYLKEAQGFQRLLPALIVVAVCIGQPRFWTPLFGAVPEPGEGYRAVGLWAREYFPAGTVIGAMQTGGLAYYAPQLHVLNLDGVVEKPAFDAIETRDLDVFMSEKGMQYYMGWPVNTKYLVEYSYQGKYPFVEKPDPQAGEPYPFLMTMMELNFVTWGQKWTLFEYKPL